MNNDLISRKALVAALIKEREQYPPMVAERYSFGVKVPHQFNQAMRGGIRKALRLVETAPAVDATPVRHARWILDTRYRISCSNGKHYTPATCSVCQTEGSPQWKCCPVCEAKMDGDSHD